MVRQNNLPLSSERRHVHSESQQIPAASELTCKSDSHSDKILNSTLYVMLMDGTHKLMIYTKGNRESEKGCWHSQGQPHTNCAKTIHMLVMEHIRNQMIYHYLLQVGIKCKASAKKWEI